MQKMVQDPREPIPEPCPNEKVRAENLVQARGLRVAHQQAAGGGQADNANEAIAGGSCKCGVNASAWRRLAHAPALHVSHDV
eukprot:CAMPEP_0115172752 /NCGR_PEP_ID=MMETSP0270-20121206/2976_1 /TAXON_ID=71861 /ORGANISM="Scrippsiella trochoidea, Strain CCMP3099" /LENGTH=81 /DNA_ID=CAMNT_0002585551 /DNA_START=458 /DNA_END=700 /DNA_ORIENTATION=-